jgi:prepilin-type N-terminal cleavage/methylation domain-containing protein
LVWFFTGIRTSRRGLTLIEILVSLAIMAIIAAISIPTLDGLLALKQRSAAKELAQTYTWLLDEAALRNVAFRVVYNLDKSTWLIEAGDPSTLVFSNPEAREDHDEQLEDDMAKYTKREIEEGAAEDAEEKSGRFTGLGNVAFKAAQTLPDGTRFAYVYTPQYEEGGLTPTKDGRIAYTYVFPDGTAEHTVIRIVDEDDESDGWTIEVLPISGDIRLTPDMIDPSESMDWIPEDGPEIR